MKHIGQQIRLFREQQGVGLNAYARKLGVSPGYLSNLERGLTDNIHLSLLDELLKQLGVQHSSPDAEFAEIQFRIERIRKQMVTLQPRFPEAVDYLLQTVEKGAAMLNQLFFDE